MSEDLVHTASLREIELDDIQLLRYWRNLDHVRSRMVQRNYIERDGQRKWFSNLDQVSVRYFIFSLQSRDVGCVNLTKLNFEDKSFEGGIFCGDTCFLTHWINIWACVKMYDYAFNELDLDVSYATILNDNKPALNLNKSLGYKFIEQIDTNFARFMLTRSDFDTASVRIRRYLSSFAKQQL